MKVQITRLLIVSCFLLISAASAQTRVAVLPLRDESGKADAADITEKIRKAINATPGFWTYPPAQFQTNVARFGLKVSDLYDPSNQKDLADLLKIDAYVEGRVTFAGKFVLDVGLRDAKSGTLTKSKQYMYASQFTDPLAKVLAFDLLGKEAEAPKAAAKKKAPAIAVAKKAEPEPLSEEREDKEWLKDRLRVSVGISMLKNTYKLDTPDNLREIDSSGSFFPMATLAGEYWFLDYLGLEFQLGRGFIGLDVPDGTGGTVSADVALSDFGGGISYRHRFMVSGRPLELIGKAGYRVLKYDVDDQPVLTDNTYSGPSIGGRVSYPFLETGTFTMGAIFGFEILPIQSISESPVETGTSASTFGYQFGGGLFAKFLGPWRADLGYSYLKYSTDFSGAGSRGVAADSSASDLFHGLVLQIGYAP